MTGLTPFARALADRPGPAPVIPKGGALAGRAESDESEYAAYHEAGHAVVARVAGLRCGGASITADGGGVATIHIGRPCADRGLCNKAEPLACRCSAAAIALYAGFEAELLLCGRARLAHVDAERAARFAAGREVVLGRAARRLIREHLGAIRAVAVALMQRRRLTGAEIDAIITPRRI